MKAGIFLWFGFLLDNSVKLKLIKNAGFSSVGLWWGSEFDDENNKYYIIPEKVYKLQLDICNVHFPYYNINELYNNNLKAKDMFVDFKEKIKLMKENNIKIAVIHPFEYNKTLPDLKKIMDVMLKLGDFANKYDVKIALENTRYTSYLMKIVETLNCDNVGYCFDSGHYNIEYQNDYIALEKMLNKIFTCHLHDNNAKADEHILPFEGNICWSEIMKRLNNKPNISYMLESIYPCEENISLSKYEASNYLINAYNSTLSFIK